MRLVAGLCLFASVATPAYSDDGAATSAEAAKSQRSGLGVRHQRVERMMEDLERKFTKLAQALQEAEPERADRLIKTLQQAKQLLIQKRLAVITKLLDEQKYEAAAVEQEKILEDLRALIKALLDDQEDKDKVKEEIARLERWQQQIENILREEYPQQREADKLANKERTLADLEARIKAVEKLIERQKGVIKTTQEARQEGGIPRLSRAADSQHEVRKDTEAVARAIAEDAKRPAPDGEHDHEHGEPKDSEESESKDGAQSGGDGPEEGSESEGSESEGSESEGSESGPKDGSPSGGQSGSQSGSQGGQKPPEPGQKPLEQAAQNQKSAEGKLQKGKGGDAQRDEENALKDLEDGLAELKNERDRIASLPPETFDQLADAQDATKEKTAELEKEMKKAGESGQSGGQGGGESGGQSGQQSGKQPGQKNVQQAQQSMQRASGDLREKDPQGASRQQDEAIRELQKALEEIQQRLAQLREETQEEKLARLEQRFTEMLARQRAITLDTVRLNDKREDGAELRRADRIALAKLATGEYDLAEMAQQALDILLEDGTSVVFPRVVEGLRDDLTSTSELLEGQRTDGYTQQLQHEIETTLEELIEALKRAQQQGGGGGGGGGGGEPPLLPTSAELKLLKAAQMRVNRRTEAIDRVRDPEEALDEVLSKDVNTISQRQLEIAIMTEEIIERSTTTPGAQ